MRPDKIYIEIGKTIEVIQLADRVFNTVLLICLPGAEASDMKIWEVNTKILEKATLGKLISILKSRAELSPEFESNLSKYLDMRNRFIHDWKNIENWNIDHEALQFIEELQKNSIWTFYMMMTIVNSWAKQTDYEFVKSEIIQNEVMERCIADIEKSWEPALQKHITKLKH